MVITNFGGGLSSRDLTNIANVVPQKEVIRTHQKVTFSFGGMTSSMGHVVAPSGSTIVKYADKANYSAWISAGAPIIAVELYDNGGWNSSARRYEYAMHYIWTIRRPVINSEKCFLNTNPGHNDDLGLWLPDSTHIIIGLGNVIYKPNMSNNTDFVSNVSGTWSYQFIEFY